MYKGAIIGFGNVAYRAHVPAWRTMPTCRITAAVDPEPACRARARALLPGIRCYETVEALLDHEELDFLDICTPPAAHDYLIQQACAYGLHVLCEKPLLLSAGAFQQIAKASDAAGVLIFPVHNWKYAPLFQTLKRLLDADEVGMPVSVELRTLRTRPAGTSGWRLQPALSGGGILMDHGWHAFYLLLFLLGNAPQSITAQIEKRRWLHTAVEDTATCTVTFPHAQGHIYLTWAARQRCNTGVIRGTRGEIRLADTHLQVWRHGRLQRQMQLPGALSTDSYHPDWLAALLPDFHAALHMPWQYDDWLREAGTCLQLTLLAYRSAALDAQPLPYAHPWLQGVL